MRDPDLRVLYTDPMNKRAMRLSFWSWGGFGQQPTDRVLVEAADGDPWYGGDQMRAELVLAALIVAGVAGVPRSAGCVDIDARQVVIPCAPY